MENQIIVVIILLVAFFVISRLIFKIKRERRRDYYRNEYLKSDVWKRKRYVVLKRDNWRCVYCGAKATQVHHKRYAKRNIGKEPIDWLVSVCDNCHNSIHHK
jgi:5-methylcytosine-specific restriction endonuclease McrA